MNNNADNWLYRRKVGRHRFYTDFGKRLKDMIDAREMTIAYLACRIGESEKRVNGYFEYAEDRVPCLEEFYKICKVFNDAEYILGFKEEDDKGIDCACKFEEGLKTIRSRVKEKIESLGITIPLLSHIAEINADRLDGFINGYDFMTTYSFYKICEVLKDPRFLLGLDN